MQKQQAQAAKEDVDVRWAEQLRDLEQLQDGMRKYLQAHNDAFRFLHDAAEKDMLTSQSAKGSGSSSTIDLCSEAS